MSKDGLLNNALDHEEKSQIDSQDRVVRSIDSSQDIVDL